MTDIIQCKRCGKCCLKSPCFLSREILKNKDKCKALEKDGEVYTCGLVRKPSDYLDLGEKAGWKDRYLRDTFSQLLGIGKYCDSDMKFDDIIRDIFGNISDEITETLLWSCTAFPMAPPSTIIQQLKDSYVESKGDPLKAIKIANEQMNKAMEEHRERRETICLNY